ncbi:STAS domain-containing protein [Nocardia sp. NPDC057353]|uniref:STAS domain-containing protein n=1 Tax=Nocardia sp. NPDC057353 TaxID=3346104 RepID=UPI003627D48B
MSRFPTRTADSGAVVVRPEGRLDMVAAPDLRKTLHALADGSAPRVVVDLGGTEFIDSSGLGALISGLKAARQAGGDLRIAAPSTQVRTVLALTKLDRVLRSYPSADTAFDTER